MTDTDSTQQALTVLRETESEGESEEKSCD